MTLGFTISSLLWSLEVIRILFLASELSISGRELAVLCSVLRIEVWRVAIFGH